MALREEEMPVLKDIKAIDQKWIIKNIYNLSGWWFGTFGLLGIMD